MLSGKEILEQNSSKIFNQGGKRGPRAQEKKLAFGTIKMDITSTVTGKEKENNVWRCKQISKFGGEKMRETTFDDYYFLNVM